MKSTAKYIIAIFIMASLVGVATVNSGIVMAQRGQQSHAMAAMTMGSHDRSQVMQGAQSNMQGAQSNMQGAQSNMQGLQSKVVFNWPYNNAYVTRNSYGGDSGTVDLCALTAFNQFNCFGQQNWKADSSGYAFVIFSPVTPGKYQCADSVATSNDDGA